MKPRPVYEINSGEGFPEVDNTTLTIDGQLEDVIERIKLNPVKEMNHEQKGMMICATFSFNTQPDITMNQSKPAIKAWGQSQAQEKRSRTQFTAGIGLVPNQLTKRHFSSDLIG